jgi:hypothetical protein
MKKHVRALIVFLLISSSIIFVPAVYAQTEEYYAVISDQSYPLTIEAGKKISITVTVDYKLPAGTVTLFVEAFDEQETTLDALAEDLNGEGSEEYTLSFNAPSEVDEYVYKVITYFMVDNDEVTFVEAGRMDFAIDVLPSSGSGVSDVVEKLGVPGFSPFALWLGLVAVGFVLNSKPRKIIKF